MYQISNPWFIKKTEYNSKLKTHDLFIPASYGKSKFWLSCSLCKQKVLPVVKNKINLDKNVIVTEVMKKFIFLILERNTLVSLVATYRPIFIYIYWVFMLLKSLIKANTVELRNCTLNSNYMIIQLLTMLFLIAKARPSEGQRRQCSRMVW